MKFLVDEIWQGSVRLTFLRNFNKSSRRGHVTHLSSMRNRLALTYLITQRRIRGIKLMQKSDLIHDNVNQFSIFT